MKTTTKTQRIPVTEETLQTGKAELDDHFKRVEFTDGKPKKPVSKGDR